MKRGFRNKRIIERRKLQKTSFNKSLLLPMRKMLIQCSLSWKIGDWKCKKCDFDTHSEGLSRQHKLTSHNLKESKQKIIVGYELYMQKFANVLGV